LKNKIVMSNKYLFRSKWSMEMKSFFLSRLLFFCLLTVITNGQNLLPQQTIENFKKSKGLMINPEEEMLMHEKSIGRDLPWQVSMGQRQNPAINPRANNRKKKEISKLNRSIYRPILAVADTNRRYSYTYDDNGNELTFLLETWTNNAWVNSYKYTNTYNNNGNRLTSLDETWTNNVWVNYWKTSDTYDNDGKRLSSLDEKWTDTAWINFSRDSSTYNNKGYLQTYLYETWTNNTWVNNYRETSSYDNNDNLLTDLYEKWVNNAWVNFDRFSYDNNGNSHAYLEEKWLDTAWVNYLSVTSTYDNNGLLLTSLQETWSNNAWISNVKVTYTYDNNGNKLTYLLETWTNNAWVNSYKYTYTYDNNGNMLTQLSETWVDNTWKNSGKSIYTFDNYGNAIKGEYTRWTNNAWVAVKGSLNLYYNSGADYLSFFNSVVTVTYTLITTDIKDNELAVTTYSLSQNYPNPFNPSTVIQYALPYESNVSISVYNTLGEVVKTFNEGAKQTGSYNVNFNGEGLSSGIYLYNLNAVSIDGKQNFQATKKMLLIK